MFSGGGMSKTPGDVVKAVIGVQPVVGAGAQNGPWLDRKNFFSAIAVLQAVTSGGVTGGTYITKLQDALDISGTGAADFSTAQTRTIAAGPNESFVEEYSWSLDAARPFIRVVMTPAPSGGTPVSTAGVALLLASANKAPV